MVDQAMIEAWRQASMDLEIRLVAPFDLIGYEDRVGQAVAYLPDFGGPRGMIVTGLDGPTSGSSGEGYYWSRLGDSYSGYDRQLFIDTLNDWGWFGDERLKPTWYTGKPWS